MKNDPENDELLDDSPTDELPVLSELDVVDDFERTALFLGFAEDTGRHTATGRADVAASEAPSADDTGRHPPLPAAESMQDHAAAETVHDPAAEMARDAVGDTRSLDAAGPGGAQTGVAGPQEGLLAARLAELARFREKAEATLADQDATIASLEERLEATREAVARRDSAERVLRQELVAKDAALADQASRTAAAEAQLEERDLKLAALERRAAELEQAGAQRDAHLAEIEDRLAERDARLAEQGALVAAKDAELAERSAKIAERDIVLAERENRLAERAARVDELGARVAERDASIREAEARILARDKELAEKDALLAARDAELAALRAGLAARHDAGEDASAPAAPGSDEPGAAPGRAGGARADSAALQRSREEAAALASYIENRRAHWNEMEARLAEQRERIGELEREVAQRAARQHHAEELADSEARRFAGLRDEVESLRRSMASQPGARAGRAQPEPQTRPPSGREEAPSSAAPDSASEAERPRGVVAAHPAALAERDAKLHERAAQQEKLQEQLAQTQAALRRLEQILVDRDRALDTKSARIESLEAELAAQLAAPRADEPPRVGPQRAPTVRKDVPTLVCLTSDAPVTYPLGKPITTIGRGAHCDIQIVTHFVSREHAKIAIADGDVQIEDLGSKNGVFVNSIRVDRETLHHGDLVTVGETQFRFLAR